jgi:hypothetical protein
MGSWLGAPNLLPVILPKDDRREARFLVLIQEALLPSCS